MKNTKQLFLGIFIINILLFNQIIFAQDVGGAGSSDNTDYNGITSIVAASITASNAINGGSSRTITTTSPKVIGSYYLFNDWDNNAVIELKTGKLFSLKQNININTKSGTIESKISENSVFAFDLENVKSVTINNNSYLIQHSKEHNKSTLFEVLGTTEDKMLLRGFKSDLRQGNPDPLRGQLNDKIIVSNLYYVKYGSSMKKIKLNRSVLDEEFGDGSSLLKKYIKSEKLSFKEDKDFKTLFNYLNRA